MRAMIPMVLAILLAGTAVAQGESPAAKARAEITGDFSKGEFEIAVKKADAALKKATDAREQAELHVLRAQALLALGQADKARAAFLAAVQKDPTVELDAARASPDAVRLLERVRGELPATLVVMVKAGDADVAIDDKDLGPAPLQTQVPGGVHVVLARGSDGRTTRVEARVPPGRKVVLEMELSEPRKSADAPEKEPDGARDAQKSPAVDQPLALESVKPTVPSVVTSVRPLRPVGLGLVIGGGVVLVAGGVALGLMLDAWNKLNDSTLPALAEGEGPTLAATGNTLQALGWVGVGVGAAAVATGGYLLWRDAQGLRPTVTMAPIPGGAMVGVGGALP